jgi:hypothetical protein
MRTVNPGWVTATHGVWKGFTVPNTHPVNPRYIVEPTGKVNRKGGVTGWRVRRVFGPRKWFGKDNKVVRNNIPTIEEARAVCAAEAVADRLDPSRLPVQEPPF